MLSLLGAPGLHLEESAGQHRPGASRSRATQVSPCQEAGCGLSDRRAPPSSGCVFKSGIGGVVIPGRHTLLCVWEDGPPGSLVPWSGYTQGV